MLHCAYSGLGSNLQLPFTQLQHAVAAISKLRESSISGVSNVYQSRPLGPAGQPDYMNAVVRLDTELAPHALLAALQAIETSQGRTRDAHWGPRTLDLDLLLYDDLVLDTEDLVIPHPQLTRRSFVLLPLSDIDPHLALPNDLPITTALAATGTEKSTVDTGNLNAVSNATAAPQPAPVPQACSLDDPDCEACQ